MKTKLAAFTMMELIVVMVLSGLIFSMAMLVINIIQEQGRHQERQHEEVLDVEQLSSLLKKDAYASTVIWVEKQQLFFEYDNHSITYHFNDKNICRSIITTSIHTDTFLLPSLSFKTSWQLQDVQIGRVDAMELKTKFFEQDFNLFIQKKYDYKTLLIE
jgi:Na+-transporting NADH:ubiquinone oxidoreductase subunit NqrC